MAVSLMDPAWMAFFSTGATLPGLATCLLAVSVKAHGYELYSLSRVGRVNDDGLLGLVVDNEVGVVVALPHPFCAVFVSSDPNPNPQVPAEG